MIMLFSWYKRRCVSIVFLVGFYINSSGQSSSFTVQYLLGETKISIIENCYKQCNTKAAFINVHDNEQTGRIAADSFLKAHGGLLVHIANDSSRNISFARHGKHFTIDPNRIYSRAGRVATLKLLSENKDTSAEPDVAYVAEEILRNYINDKPIVVALHNNTDTGFSVKTYQQISDSIPDSYKVFVNDTMDTDDFILTNDLNLFNRIKTKNLSVVWENAIAVEDDGSLSLYTARRHIPYINIETEHSHIAQQYYILTLLEDIIAGYE